MSSGHVTRPTWPGRAVHPGHHKRLDPGLFSEALLVSDPWHDARAMALRENRRLIGWRIRIRLAFQQRCCFGIFHRCRCYGFAAFVSHDSLPHRIPHALNVLHDIVTHVWHVPHGDKRRTTRGRGWGGIHIRLVREDVIMSNGKDEHLNTDNEILLTYKMKKKHIVTFTIVIFYHPQVFQSCCEYYLLTGGLVNQSASESVSPSKSQFSYGRSVSESVSHKTVSESVSRWPWLTWIPLATSSTV